MLSKDQINRACKRAMDNILNEGLTDVPLMNQAFESDFYRKDCDVRKEVTNIVTDRIMQNEFSELKLNPLNHILIPKKKYADYRDCALVDVLDETIYLTLVLSIARLIEQSRAPKKTRRVLSYRISFNAETGAIFDPTFTYTNFRKTVSSLKARTEYNVMASCDIASFYDRLNLHRLNSVLTSLPNVDEDIAHLIDKTLLFWSNSNSYGLPVGSNASRILAEAELIEVDNYLTRHNVSFCRFVDDYRIFGKNAATVDEGLERLVKALRREGLFLNPSKTKVDDISNYSIKETEFESASKAETQSKEDDGSKPKLIVAGYSGTIPLKYKSPSETEKAGLSIIDIDSLILTLQDSQTPNESDLKTLYRAISVQCRFDALSDAVSLTSKSPQFIPYTVDFLIKHADSIQKEDRAKISAALKRDFSNKGAFPYKLVSLTKLFSTPQFEDMRFVVDTYLNASKSNGGEAGRLFLQSAGNRLSRLEALEIRDCANSVSGISELRMLAHIVSNNIPPEECRPFLSNLSTRTNDPFLKEMSKNINKTCKQR